MLFPQDLKHYYGKLEDILKNVGLIAGKSGRHMKYPYTFSAKIAQFPLFFYLKNNWIWMYYPLGALGGFLVFSKIHRASNSPENVKSWAETQRKIAEKEHGH